MTKFYLYLSSSPFDEKAFRFALTEFASPYDLTVLTPTSGYLVADENFAIALAKMAFSIHESLHVTITFLCAHARGPLEDKALKQAAAYFPNQALYLTDVLMKEFSFGDYSSVPLLGAEFKEVSSELMLTAGAFLRCGLNASLAADNLIIHRNTFNYRLTRFIEKTGLDIRDYHNALLLEIYFQLGTPH